MPPPLLLVLLLVLLLQSMCPAKEVNISPSCPPRTRSTPWLSWLPQPGSDI